MDGPPKLRDGSDVPGLNAAAAALLEMFLRRPHSPMMDPEGIILATLEFPFALRFQAPLVAERFAQLVVASEGWKGVAFEVSLSMEPTVLFSDGTRVMLIPSS